MENHISHTCKGMEKKDYSFVNIVIKISLLRHVYKITCCCIQKKKNLLSANTVMPASTSGKGCMHTFWDMWDRETWVDISVMSVVKGSSANTIWKSMCLCILEYPNFSVTSATYILAANPSWDGTLFGIITMFNIPVSIVNNRLSQKAM